MELSQLATLTVSAVISVLNQTTGGALQEVGSQIVQFLQSRFKDRMNIQEVQEQPKIIQQAIISESLADAQFRTALEDLITKFNSIKNQQPGYTQNNFGNLNINAAGNQGQVTGIDQSQNFHFRSKF
ncbi:hypothetical protein [Laspinema olomoucense]|uniref:Uncharacterized protein n=1 Tax=Laspinema olomoucense D3b TaxID=2953688 RepID=A0ABT2N9T6_9CYAN|nr:hypothetical protein [Laspinema sp. D3b]MCT7979465.1 hypothetical protein [Laspinema sp. D3b]